jgi:hypothetical protein
MESHQFEYLEDVRQQENFGFKQYAQAVYRGQLLEGKRVGLGV